MIRDPAAAWRPQKPPVDFADRVATAMVRERAAMRPSLRARVGTRRSAVLLAAAASLLLVGSAWAAWKARAIEPAPVSAIAPTAPPASTAQPIALPPAAAVAAVAAVVPVVVPAASAVPIPVPVAAPTRRKILAAPAPSAAASAPRTVIVPPCICHDIACDCGPERP